MSVEQNPGLSDEVRDSVLSFYHYLFYGLREDISFYYWYLGLGQFDKRIIIQYNNNLVPLFIEGEPTVLELSYSNPGHGVSENRGHGGPVGYEVYLIHFERRSGRNGLRGEGMKYTVYHEGSAFVERAVYRLPRGPCNNFVETEELLESERPLEKKDIPQLRVVAEHVRSIHEIGAPIDYKIRVQMATLRGVSWEI